MIRKDIEAFQKRVKSELYENIIPFWQKHTVDNEFGGFAGQVGRDLKIDKHANKGLILNARILWTFAAMYRFDANPKYLELAKRAYDYLNSYFRDTQFGGMFWQVDYRGQCVDDSKKIYGQAFYVYALAEYYLATKDAAHLRGQMRCLSLSNGTASTKSIPAISRYATATGLWPKRTLSDKDMNEKKSMNNHLHIIESYTNLYRCSTSRKSRRKSSAL